MRLPPQPGERIDRSHESRFRFDGEPGARRSRATRSARRSSRRGRRVFSRSFKYHRPRGLLCCSGSCANCMMTVDGVPNVRVCVGAGARRARTSAPQNVIGSLDRDLARASSTRRRAVHAGRLLLPDDDPAAPRRGRVYERVLRSLAGLGRVDGRRADAGATTPSTGASTCSSIGGGPLGPRAARGRRGRRRPRVLLVDERAPVTRPARTRCSRPARAIGIYEGGLVPVDAGDVLLPRARREDRRRDRLGRAAARLPRQRPRRRDAARRRVRRLVDDWAQARARARSWSAPTSAGSRWPTSSAAPAIEVARRRRPPRERLAALAAARAARPPDRGHDRRRRRSTATCSSSRAAASPRTRCSRRPARASSTTPRRGIFVPVDLPAGVEAAGSASAGGAGGDSVADCGRRRRRRAASSASART